MIGDPDCHLGFFGFASLHERGGPMYQTIVIWSQSAKFVENSTAVAVVRTLIFGIERLQLCRYRLIKIRERGKCGCAPDDLVRKG
jgi:hypothetical protein